ncbi:MAG TPA: SPOR domain-containing protein, partial [Bacteroidia bacterium]|nr:SPOR domain-containing protein [Bacteroidia bacterium]
MFFMSSISLRYDLSRKTRKAGSSENGEIYEPDSHYEGVNFDAMLDDTIKPLAEKDVPQTDSAILRQYQMYLDSTGQFATIEVQNKIGAPSRRAIVEPVKYTVELGKFSKGIPADIMDKLLSIPDVKSTMMPDSSSVYTVGDYYDYNSAQNRQQQFVQNGLPDAKVVYRKGNDFIPTNAPILGNNNPNNNPVKNNQPNNNPVTNNNPNNNLVKNNQPDNNPVNHPSDNTPPTGNIVYRIQLGAYSHKLSRDVFMNINNLVEVKTENGFYTYSCGSFTNYQDAVNYKTQLLTQGFPDVFIKAYQNGKRMPLNKAGATYVTPTKEDMNELVTHESSTLDKTQISFSIQVGIFKGAPPADMASKYKQLSDVRTETDSTGLTHYVVGKYSTYQEAKAMKDKLTADPVLKGAFTVAYFKDKPIPLNQALSILKQ